MRQLLAILALGLALVAPVTRAQTDDRGVLHAFLEDKLSAAGREVRIEGFEGALSGRATIELLTIADAGGIWLTMTGVVLDWNRAGLLRGELDISEFSARQIAVARKPLASPGLPNPEARPFVLPELPVSIRIAAARVGRLVVGAPLLGETVVLTLDGSARLAGGAGQARLDATRIGGPQGRLNFDAAFANDTRELSLGLDITEAAGGVAASLLGIPGRPPLALRLGGAGPIGNYRMDVDLATDAVSRLAGTLRLDDAPDQADPEARMRAFRAELSGDLRPLVAAEYRAFLGRDLRLSVVGRRRADGRIEIDTASLDADAMTLAGAAALAPDGWPERVRLNGRIAPVSGAEVLLALPGPPTRLAGGTLSLDYDAALGDRWDLTASLEGLRRDGLDLAAARLSGTGTLAPGAHRADGRLRLEASGLRPADAALADALGTDLSGSLSFLWQAGAALDIRDIDLAGAGLALTGGMRIAGVDGQLDLSIDGDVGVATRDLSRFARLVGRDLHGAADLRLAGRLAPVSGGFDLALTGEGEDLSIGEPRLDPLLAGRTRLEIAAKRDVAGLRFERFEIAAPSAELSASGQLTSRTGDLRFRLSLDDTGMVVPAVSGPAQLAGTARRDGDRWAFDATATGPGATEARLEGALTLVEGQAGPVSGDMSLEIGELGAYAALLPGRPDGALSATLHATGDLRTGVGRTEVMAEGTDLGTGFAEADLLLRGHSRLDAALGRGADRSLSLERFALQTPQATADLTGTFAAKRGRGTFSLRLRDLALLAPGLDGPVTAQGELSAADGPWSVAGTVQGPGGTTATIDGRVARDATTADLAVAGQAPLALVNTRIAPNLASGTARFELRLAGPVRLASLSGTVRTEGARLTLPARRMALTDVSARALLGEGRARITATSDVSTGGRVSLNGDIALSPPFAADLESGLSGLAIREPGLYETLADGRLTLSGPLGGGATVSGALTVGATELRIPEGAAAADGALAGLVHLNEPPAVRQTRLRAGLTAAETQSRRVARPYPLDLTIRAPAQIFVRGRGLDAELGGTLRLTGTTANVVPQGRFDLIRGRLDILGRRLTLSEASAQLQGDFDPYIRAVARTESAGTRIEVIVEGPASAPTVRFSSSSGLPDDEILARLLFNRDLSRLSPLQALRLANAVRVLAGSGGEGIVGRLRQQFGLDDLDITQSPNGETGVRVGKYINENIYTDLSVDSTGKSEVDLNLSLSPSLTARGRVTSEGDSGIGVFFERDY